MKLFINKICLLLLISAPCLVQAQTKRPDSVYGKNKKANTKKIHIATDTVERKVPDQNRVENKSSMPRYEVRGAPLAALFLQWYTLDAGFRFTPHWALGLSTTKFVGSVEGVDSFFPEYDGFAVGMYSIYYWGLARTETWYLSSHLSYERFNIDARNTSGEIETKEFSGGRGNLILGRQLKWKQISLLLGAGGQFAIHSQNNITTGNTKTIGYGFVALECKLGFEF